MSGAAVVIIGPRGVELEGRHPQAEDGRAERWKAPKSLLMPETTLPPNFVKRIHLHTVEGVSWVSGDLQPKVSQCSEAGPDTEYRLWDGPEREGPTGFSVATGRKG